VVKSVEAKLLQNLIQRQVMMRHDFAQNGAQRAGAKRVMMGNGQMMFTANLRGQAAMRTELPDQLVAESAAQRLFQIGGGKVARKLHAVASSSSMTRCKRITAGTRPSSK